MRTGNSRIRGWSLRPPSWNLISLLLAAVVTFAGCASNTVRSSQATPTLTPTTTLPAPTATVLCPYCFAPLTLSQAWGNPAIRSLPSALPGNRVFVFDNAVTPDNQWLIGADEPRDFITNAGNRPSYLSLYNIQNGQLVHLRALLHPQSQVLAASADDTWVVWSEGDDQPNFFDWTLFAYNRQTGQVQQLAQAARAGGQPVPGGYPIPVVDAGHVIWGEALGPVGPSTLDNAVVRMEDLATGQVTTLATRAGIPNLAWPWALWGQFTSTAGTDGTGAIVITNLSTGQTEKLAQQPASISIAGTSLAWDDITSTLQTGSSTTVYLLEDFTKGTNAYVVLTTGFDQQYATLNDRLVGWSQSGVTQVYDRAEHRLVSLPVTNGESDSWVGYHTLVWPEPESKAQQDYDTQHNLIPAPTWNIIDTSTLPVQTGP